MEPINIATLSISSAGEHFQDSIKSSETYLLKKLKKYKFELRGFGVLGSNT